MARPALFEPEIAANVAALMRLAACLAVPLHLIEPLGFVLDPGRLRRVALDYAGRAGVVRHPSFDAFERARIMAGQRLVLLDPGAATSHLEVGYRPDDLLLAGRESDGVPDEVRNRADLVIAIPMAPGNRSLNVVTACAIVLGEALRQTRTFPADRSTGAVWPGRA